MIRITIFAFILLISAFGIGLTQSQEPGATEDNATELAKQTQNPVSSLVSLPFQFNFNSGGGFQDRTFFNLNFQITTLARVGR
jgi:hypothetical protein